MEQRTRSRRGEGGRLRDEIVVAAARLLDQEAGEQAVTLRAVAREAGITAPSIYPHFADRDSILLAVAEQAFAELEAHLRVVPPDLGPAERLRAICTAYLAYAQEKPNRYRIMFGAVWSAPKSLERVPDLAIQDLGMNAFDVLRGAMVACVDAGTSRSVDPAADAAAVWAGLHGLAQLRVAASLFPWPRDLEAVLVQRLALLN
ncbi:TetR/AcrR family transcriptional regulator [Kribbella italica]|uniref:AcrR family transcriptional regulator n=1 Tax=Kribbella italica TaxID=1540520 RepID=A0A7W9JF73_9ACTN|nr:TetR/AcrR family transcriptional regulator [Kribbella italica]MBB5841016.1 AcrR family transcriptional regulator [Kribbella italica]